MPEADRQAEPERDPRVYLAAERTLLAWVRTGLALMGFGFVVARFGLFLHELAEVRGTTLPAARGSGSLWIGVTLVVFGVLVNALAAADHVRNVRAFRRGDTSPSTKSAAAVVLAVLLAALGVGMAVYLLRVG